MVANKSAATTPPLENGDRLTCQEFERRYAQMPNLKKAELNRVQIEKRSFETKESGARSQELRVSSSQY